MLPEPSASDVHAWLESCERLGVPADDIGLQWNALAKITAMTGAAPNRITDREFELARTALIDAYGARGVRASGRNMASIFHRLRLTLFHAGQLDTYGHPTRRTPVSVTGWAAVVPVFADTARRRVGIRARTSHSTFGPSSAPSGGCSNPCSPPRASRFLTSDFRGRVYGAHTCIKA